MIKLTIYILVLSVKIEHLAKTLMETDNRTFELNHQVLHISAAVFKNQKIVLLQVK